MGSWLIRLGASCKRKYDRRLMLTRRRVPSRQQITALYVHNARFRSVISDAVGVLIEGIGKSLISQML